MSGNFSNFISSTYNTSYSNACVAVYTSFFITTTCLLLPLFALIIYMGYQQWRKKSSFGRATTSHSDIFTYNIIPLELFNIFVNGCYVYLMFIHQKMLIKVLRVLGTICLNGQNAIHLIACVEHYVAVLHPVMYLESKKPRNIRIRNISLVCFWVLLIGGSLSAQDVHMESASLFVTAMLILGLQVIFVAFCNISILCSITRPEPGDVHQGRRNVGLRKKRAFYTVTAIMGALLTRFFGIFLQVVCLLWMNKNCFISSLFLGFGLPSCLVQPLLFLYRAGKLGCSRGSTMAT